MRFVGCAQSVAQAFAKTHVMPSPVPVGDEEFLRAACAPDAGVGG